MKKFFSIVGSILSAIGFLALMGWVIFLLPIIPLKIILTDIGLVRAVGFSRGFSGIADTVNFIWILGIPIALSLRIPAFRKMYYRLPWMYPYVKIYYLNLVIMAIALIILNYGYEVQNETRHTVFYILMLLEIVVGRVLMSIYFNWKNAEHIGGSEYE